ncbi:MAG: hypothetical protein QOJ98_1924 [Acidobacteriota bacterium]|jgi:hypothetical protein|nr:hypothetical protein [Acidobacteriota bacterium]
MAKAEQAFGKQQLLIRFRGICSHLDLDARANGRSGNGNGENGKKRKRTVLVRHRNGNSGIEHHIPYIEFYADDVAQFSPGLRVFQYSKPGLDGTFARVDLEDGTEIRIAGMEPGYVEEESNYARDIPHMTEFVPRENRDAAHGLLVPDASDIDRERAVAVFDMPDGRLLAGEPEAMITRFEAKVGFKPRRLARWVDLYVEITEPLVLQLLSLSGDGTRREIKFKETVRMITIGNEPERLILGLMSPGDSSAAGHGDGHDHTQNGTPIQPTGHFILYYDLLQNAPVEKHVPIPTLLTGAGCPNNNIP